nr:unnamed protein product [Haemonchus contortus]
MRKPPMVNCDVIVSVEKKPIFTIRIDSGHPVERRMRDFEKMYLKAQFTTTLGNPDYDEKWKTRSKLVRLR